MTWTACFHCIDCGEVFPLPPGPPPAPRVPQDCPNSGGCLLVFAYQEGDLPEGEGPEADPRAAFLASLRTGGEGE